MITSPEELPEKRPVFTSEGCVDVVLEGPGDKTVRPSRFIWDGPIPRRKQPKPPEPPETTDKPSPPE
jgi:hypothetical protein